MSDFIIEEVVENSEKFNGRLYPLPRADKLKYEFSKMFSGHLGRMKSGRYFEGEVLIVIGASGSGKTTEIEKLIEDFNSSQVPLPRGTRATFAKCVLNRKETWKDLGKGTLHAMNYPIVNNARITQAQISRQIKYQGEHQGVVGVWYDEAQHILARKNEEAIEVVLDCFKSMLKGPDWPMMLVLSGVPELASYIPQFEQLFRKVTLISFEDIDFDKDAPTVNSIVGSFALLAKLSVADDLMGGEFLHRLATAGAFRWGLVFELITKAVDVAKVAGCAELEREHFIEAWVSKTGMNHAATPFTHSGYVTSFPRNTPFRTSL